MAIGLLQQKIYYSRLAIFLVKDGRLQSHNGHKVFFPNNKKCIQDVILMHAPMLTLCRSTYYYFGARILDTSTLGQRTTLPILDPGHPFSLKVV